MKNLDWLLFWGPCQACDSVPFDFLVSTASREAGPGHSETLAPREKSGVQVVCLPEEKRCLAEVKAEATFSG
ncbi:hypothetical protein CapIbe_001676 [Capra ibex]